MLHAVGNLEEQRSSLAYQQFEELFSDKTIEADQRRSFIQLLSALAGGGRVWMIATLRSDF